MKNGTDRHLIRRRLPPRTELTAFAGLVLREKLRLPRGPVPGYYLSALQMAPVTPCARVLSLLIRYMWALPNTLIGLLFVPTAMLPRGRMQVIDGVLEAHGPLISAMLRHSVPIPGGASAITFGHVVLARDRWSLDATRAHERVHVRQCEIWGPAFMPAYLIAGLWGLMSGTGAYTGNYFERQANSLHVVTGELMLAHDIRPDRHSK